MSSLGSFDDRCLTVRKIADRLRLKSNTIRRLFMKQPEVVVTSLSKKEGACRGSRAFLPKSMSHPWHAQTRLTTTPNARPFR